MGMAQGVGGGVWLIWFLLEIPELFSNKSKTAQSAQTDLPYFT